MYYVNFYVKMKKVGFYVKPTVIYYKSIKYKLLYFIILQPYLGLLPPGSRQDPAFF